MNQSYFARQPCGNPGRGMQRDHFSSVVPGASLSHTYQA
jgi:hypothetical protein